METFKTTFWHFNSRKQENKSSLFHNVTSKVIGEQYAKTKKYTSSPIMEQVLKSSSTRTPKLMTWLNSYRCTVIYLATSGLRALRALRPRRKWPSAASWDSRALHVRPLLLPYTIFPVPVFSELTLPNSNFPPFLLNQGRNSNFPHFPIPHSNFLHYSLRLRQISCISSWIRVQIQISRLFPSLGVKIQIFFIIPSIHFKIQISRVLFWIRVNI